MTSLNSALQARQRQPDQLPPSGSVPPSATVNDYGSFVTSIPHHRPRGLPPPPSPPARPAHLIVSTRTMAWQAGHFARLNTNSSVTPAGVRGFVSFNSSSVIDVTIRR